MPKYNHPWMGIAPHPNMIQDIVERRLAMEDYLEMGYEDPNDILYEMFGLTMTRIWTMPLIHGQMIKKFGI